MKTELLIMAAGMGSRFGGLKQIEPLGPNGEIILDFSVYDAVKAGFDKVVFVIKKEIEKDFRAACGKRIEKMIDVDYAFQEKDDLPDGFTLPKTREKPWGTGQAVLSAKNIITSPFAVINADDYYGRESFEIIYNHLVSDSDMCMVGYKLGNTITDNGTVTRGVCETENGYLTKITECSGLDKNSEYPMDTIVSMNMWGLDTGVFNFLEEQFPLFLKDNINEPKKEFLLPTILNDRMNKENKKIKVLSTDSQWYGVTYREDSPGVSAAMREFIGKGMYDFK